LRQGLTWHAYTVQPPAITGSEPADGATQQRFSSLLRLNFASPMDRDTLQGKVVITPEPAGDPNGRYDAWDWSLRFYGLAPSTTYTVQILPGMQDLYGNVIDEERTLTFTTAPYTPIASFNFPGRLSLYRRGGSAAAWMLPCTGSANGSLPACWTGRSSRPITCLLTRTWSGANRARCQANSTNGFRLVLISTRPAVSCRPASTS
jgi:hypothetical protein